MTGSPATMRGMENRSKGVATFLESHSDVESVDLYAYDLNGVPRGKRVPVSDLAKAAAHGVALPASLFASDITGDTVPGTGWSLKIGDRDFDFQLVEGSLARQPWGTRPAAQAQIRPFGDDGAPLPIDPLTALERVLARYADRGLRPVIALELEFYLVRRTDGGIVPVQSPVSGREESQIQVYSLTALDDYAGFIDAVTNACLVQSIPATAVSSEFSPGQFEINLRHTEDVPAACRHSLALKRAVKRVAESLDFQATFMAKPFTDLPGSGTHVHISVLNADGRNVFGREGSAQILLERAIAGVLAATPPAMAIMAPHANSYRRLRPSSFAPVRTNWGDNNRTVAVRVPTGEPRLEHRVAGADAQPYLLVAALLAGLLDGLDEKREPGPAVSGNGYDQELGAPLPATWERALDAFAGAKALRAALGEPICELYETIKSAERRQFENHVSPLEFDWYLRDA